MPRKINTFKPPWVPSKQDNRRAYASTEERRADNRFYASTGWIKVRLIKLSESPTCEECLKRGVITVATEVHHIKERRDFPELALDLTNLQSLCKACHGSMRKKRQ